MNETGCLDVDKEVKSEQVKGYKNEVPKLDAGNISYSEFFCSFILKNQPGILRGVTNDWNCTKLWVMNESLNVEYFLEKYGNTGVPVSNCGKRWFNVQEKSTMMMKDYLSYWNTYMKDPYKMDCLYLKDWHFMKEFPDENMYRVPCYFASDWLNEYYDNNKHLDDDFRFVYIGPKGSWTPFHSDVLTSFSWSANICGRKKWILLPPGVEENFKDEFGHFKYDINQNDSRQSEICEVTQEKGEIIFVPSGWYHQVHNLEDAISVNHNWINACNIFNVWESLKSSLTDVKREIYDCEGVECWDEDCQRLLRASFGLDYYQFYLFVNVIAKARMEKLKQGKSLMVYGDWFIGKNHMIFDLKQISSLLKVIVDDADFRKLSFTQGPDDPVRFSEILTHFLNSEIYS